LAAALSQKDGVMVGDYFVPCAPASLAIALKKKIFRSGKSFS